MDDETQITELKCANGHVMETAWRVCPLCGKPAPQADAISLEIRPPDSNSDEQVPASLGTFFGSNHVADQDPPPKAKQHDGPPYRRPLVITTVCLLLIGLAIFGGVQTARYHSATARIAFLVPKALSLSEQNYDLTRQNDTLTTQHQQCVLAMAAAGKAIQQAGAALQDETTVFDNLRVAGAPLDAGNALLQDWAAWRAAAASFAQVGPGCVPVQ